MDNNVQALLDILKVTYLGKAVSFNIESPRQLYRIAKENGLSGTIYETIKDQIDEKEVLARFKKDFFKYISDDEKKSNIINEISTVLNAKKIEHIYLKGSSLKKVYPRSYMRSMGDIDLLVREQDFDKANDELIVNGFVRDSQGPVHNVFYFGDTEVELHRKLVLDADKDQFLLLKNIWDYCQKTNASKWIISTEQEIIFLLYHIRKHLLSSGVGLRNILDIGIYLNHSNQIDLEILKQGLDTTNLTRLYSNILMFNEKYLDLDLSNCYIETIEFDNKLYESFTEYIIRSGVHGLGYDFNQFVARFAKDQKQDIGKRKSLIRFMFPPYNFMKEKYPKMMKYKILLPIGWIRRFFRLIFKRTKKILLYLHFIKKADQADIDKTSDLFTKLGI